MPEYYFGHFSYAARLSCNKSLVIRLVSINAIRFPDFKMVKLPSVFISLNFCPFFKPCLVNFTLIIIIYLYDVFIFYLICDYALLYYNAWLLNIQIAATLPLSFRIGLMSRLVNTRILLVFLSCYLRFLGGVLYSV